MLGTIASDVERRPGRRVFVLQVRAVHDYTATRTASGRLQVMLREPRQLGTARPPTLFHGDQVWLRGRLKAPRAATNPGGFDYAAYLARRGIFATLTPRRAADIRVVSHASGLSLAGLAARLRGAVQAATAHHLSRDDAALLDGLLLSIRGGIPADLEDAFSRTGTVHVLSTSGLHLAVLAAFLIGLFQALPVSHSAAIRAGAILSLIWLFALAAGAGPAVTRSALMLSIVLAAPLARRAADPVNSLIVAALLILIAQPLALYDAGTQLSFAAVGTLLAWMPPLERLLYPWEPGMGWMHRWLRAALLALLVGVVAQAGSWPLVALHFNLFSFVAPVANLPIAALTGLLLLGGLAAVVLSPLPFVGGLAFAVFLSPGLALLRVLVLSFAAVPWAALSVASPPVAFVVLYYVLLWGVAPPVNRYVLRKTFFAPRADPAVVAGGGGGRVETAASGS